MTNWGTIDSWVNDFWGALEDGDLEAIEVNRKGIEEMKAKAEAETKRLFANIHSWSAPGSADEVVCGRFMTLEWLGNDINELEKINRALAKIEAFEEALPGSGECQGMANNNMRAAS